jgi:peptide deformylase
MILPIVVYGAPILRMQTEDIEENTPELQTLIDDMVETMRGAAGIGLAAPQVGRLERLFVIDLGPMAEDLAEEGVELPPQPMVFINPEIVDESGEESGFEEGCLSIPDLREEVTRPSGIRLTFLDRDFKLQEIAVSGLFARVIQHEYDHLEGVLFTDRLSAFRRRLLQGRLNDIARGKVDVDYRMKFATR